MGMLRIAARDELIRIVTMSRHPPYGKRTGILSIAYELRSTNSLSITDRDELSKLLDWFETNLAIPDRFTRSRYPRAQQTALSWLRRSALEHVDRLHRLATIVGQSDIKSETLRTHRPGYIVYEDPHQVVAFPFRETPQ